MSKEMSGVEILRAVRTRGFMQNHNGAQIPFMNEDHAFEDLSIQVADLRRGAQVKSKNRVSQTRLCDIGCHVIV